MTWTGDRGHGSSSEGVRTAQNDVIRLSFEATVRDETRPSDSSLHQANSSAESRVARHSTHISHRDDLSISSHTPTILVDPCPAFPACQLPCIAREGRDPSWKGNSHLHTKGSADRTHAPSAILHARNEPIASTASHPADHRDCR